MSDELVCPSCGADDHLRGERNGDLVRITCSACNLGPTCDPDLLRRFVDSGTPLPPDENPAADMG